jgi:hypothetical protein
MVSIAPALSVREWTLLPVNEEYSKSREDRAVDA